MKNFLLGVAGVVAVFVINGVYEFIVYGALPALFGVH